MGEKTDRTEYIRNWQEKNRERHLATKRAWHEANKEKEKAQRKEYREKNKDALSAYARGHYTANRESYREVQRRYRLRVREKVLTHYGNACACCGESSHEFLAIDHINGGGNSERKAYKDTNSHTFYRRIVKEGFPDIYRILCHNCNMAIGIYGYCPHQKPQSDK